MGDQIKVISLNCKGLNNKIKASRIENSLFKLKPSILFLQETHIKKPDQKIFKSRWFDTQYQAPGNSKSRGVAILLSRTITFHFQDQQIDPNGRYLFIKGLINGEKYTLATLYAPNNAQELFIATTLTLLGKFKEGHVIVGGDFNNILNHQWDKTYKKDYKTGNLSKKPETSKLQHLIDQHDLKDIWRIQNTGVRDYTYFSPTHNIFTRIDLLLVSQSLINRVLNTNIGLRTLSDHAWTEFSLMENNIDKIVKTWSLNTRLLFNPVVTDELEEQIKEYFQLNSSCGVAQEIVWDAMKSVVRGKFISLSSYKNWTGC